MNSSLGARHTTAETLYPGLC